MVFGGATHTHRLLRSRVAIMLALTALVDAVGSVLMYSLEHANRASGFHDFGGAVFWVSAQLTTVSSQLPNPVTTPGRVLDIGFEIWAISIVAALAGALGAFFHARHMETRHQLPAS